MAWTVIPDSDIDPDSPITTGLMTGIRDNFAAMAAGDSGAPELLASVGASVILLASEIASASSSIEFTDLDGTYDHYILKIANARPATDGAALKLKVSTDNGSTWKGGTDYKYYQTRQVDAGTEVTISSTGTSDFNMANNVGNLTSEGVSGNVDIFTPANAAQPSRFLSLFAASNSGAQLERILAGGKWSVITAVDAIQIIFSSGNITSGEFRLYGIKDA